MIEMASILGFEADPSVTYQEFNEFCGSLPHTTYVMQWGESHVWKVAGKVFAIGGWNEKPNLEIVRTVCALLDELKPSPQGPYSNLITYVKDRPGHDRLYAIDARKIERELGWRPAETFETGIRKTVQWYLDHQEWVAEVQSGSYRDWVAANYGDR